MGIGIGGGFGPFRVGVSTRGFGVGLGPVSAGSGWGGKGRRRPTKRKPSVSPSERPARSQPVRAPQRHESYPGLHQVLQGLEQTFAYLAGEDLPWVGMLTPTTLQLGDRTGLSGGIITIYASGSLDTVNSGGRLAFWQLGDDLEVQVDSERSLLTIERSGEPGPLLVGGSAEEVVYLSVCLGLAAGQITPKDADAALVDLATTLLDDLPSASVLPDLVAPHVVARLAARS